MTMTDLNLVTEDDESFILVDDECWVPEWLGDSVSIPGTPRGYRRIDVSFLKDLCQGGCASGAYMPAVTYYDAKRTMDQHGDEIIEYLWEQFGEWPSSDLASNGSWGGLCCHYFSMAVENWAMGLLAQAEIDY